MSSRQPAAAQRRAIVVDRAHGTRRRRKSVAKPAFARGAGNVVDLAGVGQRQRDQARHDAQDGERAVAQQQRDDGEHGRCREEVLAQVAEGRSASASPAADGDVRCAGRRLPRRGASSMPPTRPAPALHTRRTQAIDILAAAYPVAIAAHASAHRHTIPQPRSANQEAILGKGDRRTRRGKIYNGSHGKTRPGREPKKEPAPTLASSTRPGTTPRR
jgi:ribosomal small subunit protein bTHX